MFCVSLITHLILPTGRNMHSVVVVCRKFLTVPGVLTATSLRHPIARVMSLYWYEHVAWYNEVTHEMNKCKPLSEWVSSNMLSVMLFPLKSHYICLLLGGCLGRWQRLEAKVFGQEPYISLCRSPELLCQKLFWLDGCRWPSLTRTSAGRQRHALSHGCGAAHRTYARAQYLGFA